MYYVSRRRACTKRTWKRSNGRREPNAITLDTSASRPGRALPPLYYDHLRSAYSLNEVQVFFGCFIFIFDDYTRTWCGWRHGLLWSMETELNGTAGRVLWRPGQPLALLTGPEWDEMKTSYRGDEWGWAILWAIFFQQKLFRKWFCKKFFSRFPFIGLIVFKSNGIRL